VITHAAPRAVRSSNCAELSPDMAGQPGLAGSVGLGAAIGGKQDLTRW
jgi:hypothetical protein